MQNLLSEKKAYLKTCLIGFLLTTFFWAFTWHNISEPKTYNFDEFHYVPAALSMLHSDKIINTEHPPLGKRIIAQGISFLGNNPKGWRIMSSLFGALTLAGIYLWALNLFSSTRTAIFAAIITFANQLLFVQARIAMLDTFMTAFLVWGSLCFSYWWKNKDKKWSLYWCGFFFALSIATKWFSLIPMAVVGILLLLSFYEGKTQLKTLIIFSMVFLIAYFATFYPQNLIEAQMLIWNGQKNVPNAHPYSSAWWTWPLQIRPIWYTFESVPGKDLVLPVIFLGNPLIIWGGNVAVLYCAWLAFFKRSVISREVLLAYLVCILAWAIIPRKLSFFYYYYPAAIMLSLVLANALEKTKYRWIFAATSVAVFIYFYPIISATPIRPSTLWAWMWFSSWI